MTSKTCDSFFSEEVEIEQHLIETDGVEHKAQVHAGDGEVGDKRKPQELPQWDMLRCRKPGGIRHKASKCSHGKVESGQSCCWESHKAKLEDMEQGWIVTSTRQSGKYNPLPEPGRNEL